jgi:hypothetical protein
MNTGKVPYEPHSYGAPGQVLGAVLFPKPPHPYVVGKDTSIEACICLMMVTMKGKDVERPHREPRGPHRPSACQNPIE